MPNLIGYAALYGFPFLALLLFRRMPVPAALCWTILLGYLFLPERGGFDLPVLPPFDKLLIPSFCAALGCFFMSRQAQARPRSALSAAPPPAATAAGAAAGGLSRGPASPGDVAHPQSAGARLPGRFRSARGQGLPDAAPSGASRSARLAGPGIGAALTAPGLPGASGHAAPARPARAARPLQPADHVLPAAPKRAPWITGLLVLVLAMPFLTMLQNGSPVVMGGRVLPGVSLYDAGGEIIEALVMLIPFLLARRFLATTEAHVTLLRVFVICGLVYSALILIEVRLSPQLNVWIYGFMNHSFAQHMRAGGYRPMIFLNHGLWVGIFIAMTVLSAFTLFRWSHLGTRSRWLAAGGWLFVTLVLSKTIGALGLTLALLPVVLICGVRIQLLVAAVLGMIVLFYPMLRGAGFIPVQQIHDFAASISTDRAASLLYRLRNEDILLARANEKPFFGWGGWGRWLIYDESGEMISVVDGAWIIIMGIGGWVGYIAQFGLLTLPLLALALSRRRLELGLATSGLALVLAVNLVDLIPNATLTPLTWLVAGALAGRYEMGRIAAGQEPAEAPAAGKAGRRRGAAASPGAAVPGGRLARRGG